MISEFLHAPVQMCFLCKAQKGLLGAPVQVNCNIPVKFSCNLVVKDSDMN